MKSTFAHFLWINILDIFAVIVIPLSEFVLQTQFVEIHDTYYKIGLVLQDKVDKGGIPCFIIIRNIFLMDDKILLGCQGLTNLGFDNHFWAYKIDFEDFFYIISINFNNLHFKSSYVFKNKFVMWD